MIIVTFISFRSLLTNVKSNDLKKIQLLSLFIFLHLGLYAQESKEKIPKRVYTTKSIGEITAPVIDGIIDDESWNLVEWDGDFIEREPDENTPSISANEIQNTL